MAWDTWTIVLRDVQLVLLANVLAPGFYLVFQERMPAILLTVLASAGVGLVAYWAPTLAAGAFLIFLPGVPFGIVTGWIISIIFDHFQAPAEPGAPDPPALGASDDATRPRQAHRLVMLAALLANALLYVANVAVAFSSLSFVLWLVTLGSALVFVATWFALRSFADWRKAWMFYGIIYVVTVWLVTLVVWLSESFFWAYLTLILVDVMAMAFVYLTSIYTSRDLRAAAGNVFDTLNAPQEAPAPSPSVVSRAPTMGAARAPLTDEFETGSFIQLGSPSAGVPPTRPAAGRPAAPQAAHPPPVSTGTPTFSPTAYF
jgi:hypothetical protein